MMKRTKKVLIAALASIMVLGSATAFTSCEAVEGMLGNIPFLSGLFGTEATLESIKVTANPKKMDYVEGEKFDPAGMEVTAFYSDGSEKVVTDWTYSPTGELTKGQKVEVSYTEGEVTQKATVSIKVTNDIVNLQILTGPTKVEYMAGETFDPAGMVLKASYENGDVKELPISEINVQYPTYALTANDTVIKITYNSFELSQQITLLDGLFIEAADAKIVSSTVQISNDSDTANSGQYVGNLRANDTLTFSFISDQEGTGNLKFRLASQYLQEAGGDDNWEPILIGECQLNKICELYVNGNEYDIDNSVVLLGGGESGGETNEDLWFNWKDISLTNVSFVEGRNDITLKFIEHEYDSCQDEFDGVFAANVDSLIVTSDACTLNPFELSMNQDYKLTGVDMVVEDGVPYLVYTGTNLIARGYNNSELAAAIKLDLQRTSDWKTFINNGEGRTITVDADGNFTLKVDISSARTDGTYSVRFGYPLNQWGDPNGAYQSSGVTVATKEDGSNKTFTISGHAYELVPDDPNTWNMVVIKITTDSSYTLNETAKLVVEDGQVYFVVESTWTGYTKDEALQYCTQFANFQELWDYEVNYGAVAKTVVDENSRKLYISISDMVVEDVNPYFCHTSDGNMAIKVSENPDDLTVTLDGKTYTLSNNVETSTDGNVSWTNGLTIIRVTNA